MDLVLRKYQGKMERVYWRYLVFGCSVNGGNIWEICVWYFMLYHNEYFDHFTESNLNLILYPFLDENTYIYLQYTFLYTM